MAYENEHFIDSTKSVWNYSLFTEEIIKLFQQGSLKNGFDFFGSHSIDVLNKPGYYFSVWAPNAQFVSIIGDFNHWNEKEHPLFVRLDHSGIWEGFIPHLKKGQLYKYHIISVQNNVTIKSDPYAVYSELRPGTASVLWNLDYNWKDKSWLNSRIKNNALHSPWNVYELHLASWMRPNKMDENSFHTYETLSDLLIPYVVEMGFTHVEFMPLTEYPYDASWGYQCTGYFSATARFGEPEGLMKLIDQLHQHQIGVILDWVPSHFPGDAHGLYYFDGAHTYEYADPQKGFHPAWNSYIFNYKRGEVQSFLLSSAYFWLKKYHMDGLRVDAVNSIIRLDYSRKKGSWTPNEIGTNENLEASAFLKKLNELIYTDFPDVQTIAEDASDWPGITQSVKKGGYGFGMKWMMGWMHDTFTYFKKPLPLRQFYQDIFSFSMMYFYNEIFMLPLSHDEFVHEKSPLIYKMQGFESEKFSNIRLLYTYMYTHPGTKLLFMGNEFGQTTEWNEKKELDWHLLQHDSHNKLKKCVKTLSHLYKNEPALYEYQFKPEGFEWIELNKKTEGIIAYKRKGKKKKNDLLIVLNISTTDYFNYPMRIYGKQCWSEIFNSNSIDYWGNGEGLNDQVILHDYNKKTKMVTININIPALSALIFH